VRMSPPSYLGRQSYSFRSMCTYLFIRTGYSPFYPRLCSSHRYGECLPPPSVLLCRTPPLLPPPPPCATSFNKYPDAHARLHGEAEERDKWEILYGHRRIPRLDAGSARCPRPVSPHLMSRIAPQAGFFRLEDS
jgi:hypothetical protein